MKFSQNENVFLSFNVLKLSKYFLTKSPREFSELPIFKLSLRIPNGHHRLQLSRFSPQADLAGQLMVFSVCNQRVSWLAPFTLSRKTISQPASAWFPSFTL